jgi:hypothetical protein
VFLKLQNSWDRRRTSKLHLTYEELHRIKSDAQTQRALLQVCCSMSQSRNATREQFAHPVRVFIVSYRALASLQPFRIYSLQ